MIWQILLGLLVLILLSGFRIVRPVDKAIVERFGKFNNVREQGLRWIIPIVDRMLKVNITEQMVDIIPQMVITKDKLNAEVDAVVYYKVIDVKKSIYNVDDHEAQLVSLARTTLRAVIGKMTLTDANENRDKINSQVEKILDKETKAYGVDVLRVELQRIEPPQDVQESMNMVVKAEQEKTAAKDLATATETKADGEKRAEIKVAQGKSQAIVLVADADAKRIKVVNEAAKKYFTGNAQVLKKLEVTENSLKRGTKYVIDSKSNLVNVMSDASGTPHIIPTKKK